METKTKETVGYMSADQEKHCKVHKWISSYHCGNKIGIHTLTYLLAYRESVKTSGEVETVSICDMCYRVIRNKDDHIVKSVDDIRTRFDIVVR